MRYPAALLLALTAALTCGAQDDRPPSTEEAMSKPSPLVREGRMRVADALALAFSSSTLAGGLQLIRCGREEALVDVKDHASLKSIVDQAIAAAPHSKVEFSKEGAINLSLPGTTVAFLETRIGAADIEMPQHNGNVAISALFSLPEVKLAVQTLGLTQVAGPMGFSRLPRPGSAAKIDRIALGDVTVRDALNEIALRLGNGFWVYEEDRCAERREFSISFRVD